MSQLNAFTKLVLGVHENQSHTDIARITSNLTKTINEFSENLLTLNLEITHERLMAPFYARVILEASMTMFSLLCKKMCYYYTIRYLF